MPHWTDELRTSLQGELTQLGEAGRGVWGDLRPQAKPPSPRQRANEFLAMDTMQRQQLALELGPEGYKEFVDERISDVAGILGPAAYNLYHYFMQGVPVDEPPDPFAEIDLMMNEALDEDI